MRAPLGAVAVLGALAGDEIVIHGGRSPTGLDAIAWAIRPSSKSKKGRFPSPDQPTC